MPCKESGHWVYGFLFRISLHPEVVHSNIVLSFCKNHFEGFVPQEGHGSCNINSGYDGLQPLWLRAYFAFDV